MTPAVVSSERLTLGLSVAQSLLPRMDDQIQ
jgi:hypothetical protein